MKYRIWIIVSTMLLLGCSSSFRYHYISRNDSKKCVVLLHGLRSSSFIWGKLEKSLQVNGYSVLKVDYPSSKYTIQTLAEKSIGEALQKCRAAGVDTISFVAHSMGNILLRYYLQEHDIPELFRIVMLSPPNQGSEIVDKFENHKLFQIVNGPAGMQLGAKEDGFVKSLPIPNCEFGIITGRKSLNWIASVFIPGKDDGRVSLQNAKLEGMKGFKVVKSNHHFIMKNKIAVRSAVDFLNYGYFDKKVN